jgi:hypothetical protein
VSITNFVLWSQPVRHICAHCHLIPTQLFDSTQDGLQSEIIRIGVCLRGGQATWGFFPLDMALRITSCTRAHSSQMCSIPRGQMHTCVVTKAVAKGVPVDTLVGLANRIIYDVRYTIYYTNYTYNETKMPYSPYKRVIIRIR